ncbi:MAG: glycosyltransferase [Lachnospiraceae bacterium]|nr:glycosyltransferase [Lachnospiraceae bacterium]
MKVCLLNDSFPPVIDGVANVVMNYADILQKEKLADVLVGTPRYPDTNYGEYPYTVIPYQSFDTTKIVKGYRAGNPLDIEEIADMAAFVPDIIHTHCPVASTVVARMLRAKTDAPVIFTYHTKFDVDIAKAVKAKFIQKETIRLLVNNIEACDEVWVVSKGAGENLKSLGYEGEYRVVNNGVDFAKGRVAVEEVKKVTKGYDLPEGIPVFLFVGRIIRYKGIPLILNSLSKLAESGQDFRMVFVGSGPDEEELKNQARTLGLLDGVEHDKCIFTGPIYDRNVLRAWNTRADLFLFPSVYDTNGIVVREAAACGLPSVLIAGSCAAEGIIHGRNGYLIEENEDSFLTLLKEVCKNMEAVHQVGQHAMDEIYISWKDSVYEAHKRYGEILDLKKSGKLESRKYFISSRFNELSMDLIQGTESVFHFPKRVLYEVKDNLSEIPKQIEEFQENYLEEMMETFHISEILEDIRKNRK